MNAQNMGSQPSKANPEDMGQTTRMEHARKDAQRKDADHKAEQAARSVMHPDSFDPEWRYYHGAWGG